MSIRKRIVSFALVYTAAVIFSLLTLLSADTHSPWFLTNHAVDVAPQSSLDIISSTINSTHILVLDSDCQIRQFTYNASSITSLGVIVGFPRTQIDGGLCDTEWAPWRATSSALIKWNPFKNRLVLWKYVHDYGPAGHRAQVFEFDGPTQTDRLTFDYVSDNITFFQKAFAYPSTSFYIDPTTGFFYGCVFNNGTLDPEGDGGFFIARINNLISTATHIFNMTLPVSSIQFNCSKIVSVLCVFTTTRTVIEYRISDLSFHGMYSLDSNALSLYLDPASIQVPGENSILYFHRKANQSNQMVLQNMNFTGFTLQTFTIPYTLSFPYDTPVYDIAMSPSGTIYTAFSTMLNSSLSRGGTDIVVTKHSPSLQRISSIVLSTIKSDNISRIFPIGNDAIIIVGVNEGVLQDPTTETARQIFVAQFLYSDISVVSTLSPNSVMANELVAISFNQPLPLKTFNGVPRVTFGGKNCTDVAWNASQLMARIPIGVQGPYDLLVFFDYLLYNPSAKSSGLSYGQPVLQNVYPSQGAAAGYNITLTAEKIGAPGVDVVVVTVGGKECLNVVYEIPNTVTCTVPPGSGSKRLIISVGPISNSTESVFISYDPPVISQIQPNIGPTQGQNSIFINGYNFGPCPIGNCDATVNDIQVTIGGLNCSALQQFNDTRLKCEAPEGAGVGHLVVLFVSGRTSTEVIQYSYLPPTFSNVIPASIAQSNPTVYLEGDNFGRVSDTRTIIFKNINDTAEYVCPTIFWVSHQSLRCQFTTVNLPLYSTFNITVQVGGQTNILSPVARFKTGTPNAPPVALPYNSTIDEDTLLIAELRVEDLDTDDVVQAYITSNPKNGNLYQITSSGARGALIDSNSTATLVSDSFLRVMYMPSPNFHGNDSFYFNAKDRSNAESNTAVANITILPVPDPPYPLSDEIQTDEDTPKIFVLRANYYDNLSSPNNSISIMSLPNKGQLFYTQNMSSYSQDWMPVTEVPLTLPVSIGIVFVPMPDDNGVPYTRFTFAATDMILNSTVNATVTINVVPRNDPPYFNLSSVTNVTAMEDTETVLNFDIGDVDMDNRLSVKISDIRINGTLYHINQQTGRRSSAAVGEGSELIGPSYEVVYTPYSNFFTENSSTYQRFNVVITDLSIGGISFTREIAFPVLPENDPPDLICNTQSIILPPDFLTGSADRFSFNLMATDVDDNSLAYVLQETPSIGEFRDNSGLPIKQNDTFLSTNLTYHSTKSGGIYPFPKFTVYVVDSHSATSKPCTYEFTIDCPPGKYNNIFSNASGPICDTCPDGAICSHIGKLPPRPQFGYWRSDRNLTYLPCFPAKACPGSEANSCASGYDGTRCGQCIRGYYRLGENCLECTSTNAIQLIIIAICLFVIGPLVLFLSRSLRGGLSFAILSIGINFVQTILIIRQLQIDWPPQFHEALNLIVVVNFNIDFASPECYLFEQSLDFSAKMKLSLAVPIILAAIIASVFVFQYLLVYIYHAFWSRSNQTVGGIREHMSRFSRTMNVLLIFVYTSVTTHSLALFDCTQESDGQIYLDADRSLRCYENWWFQDLLFAIPAVCIYVFGIPAYFAFVAFPIFRTMSFHRYFFRTKVLKNDDTQYDSSFKSEYQFFVVVQLLQKLILIIISMFLTRYTGLQIVLNLTILLISFQLILKYKPYRFESLNRLELLSHLAAMAVLAFGLPFHIDRSGAQSYKFFLMVFILFVIFGFIFILLCVLVYELLRRRVADDTDTKNAAVSKSVLLYS